MHIGSRVSQLQVGTRVLVVLCAVTLVGLIMYPIPLCFDCEFPNPWGHVPAKGEAPVAVLVVLTPFLAGAFALRPGWIVPLFVVIAFLLTQPLGGVHWRSLRDNEGPIIIVLGVPLAMTSFGTGYLVHTIIGFAKRWRVAR